MKYSAALRANVAHRGVTEQCRVKDTRSLANQRFHIDVKSLCSSEVWVDAVFVQNYLCDTFFNQLVIQRPTRHNRIQSCSMNITSTVPHFNYEWHSSPLQSF